MKPLQLAPSILTADFGKLDAEIKAVEEYVDWFHLDVMDGHYVDNLTFGPSTVEAIRRATERPLHVHLMITDPAKYAPAFVSAGASRVSFHPEVVDDVRGVMDVIARAGAGAGLAVHPDVPVGLCAPYLDGVQVLLMMTVRPGFGGQSFLPEVLPKIEEACRLLETEGLSPDVDVEVDGGVNMVTVEEAVAAGGEILVAGSAVFDGANPAAAARRLRDRLRSLEKETR